MNILKNKKKLINLLILGILILAIPLTIFLVRQQQIFKGRAAGGDVEFFKCTTCGPLIALTGAITQGFTLNSSGDAEIGIRFTAPTSYAASGSVALPDSVSNPTPTPTSASKAPVIIGGKDYGDGSVYGAKPIGGFWDDNGPSGPGWYVSSTQAPTSVPTQAQPTSQPSATSVPSPTSAPAQKVDADGDGYPVGVDCYDQNANAKPGQYQFFTTHRGDGSFDYDCDGVVFMGGILGQATSLPSAGCYSAKPSGQMGWAGPQPSCGGTGVSRRCNSNSALSCAGQEAASGILECSDYGPALSWRIVENTISPVSCR